MAQALFEGGTLRVRVSRSNANPMVRTLMHLTQDPPFPRVMLGSPAPFAMLALGNLIDVIGNFPCVTPNRGYASSPAVTPA